jgi:hypothetical protein
MQINGISRNLTGTYHCDNDAEMSAMELDTNFLNYQYQTQVYGRKKDGFLNINGVCRPSSRKFNNFFSWLALPSVTYLKQDSYNGTKCNVWQLKSKGVVGKRGVLRVWRLFFLKKTKTTSAVVEACATTDSVLYLFSYYPKKVCFILKYFSSMIVDVASTKNEI